MARRSNENGSTMVEFVLVSVPLLFALISVWEMGRGMWNYHTLQYAVKSTGRYVAVHGSTCGVPPNACTVKIKDIVAVFKSLATGIPEGQVILTFASASGTTVTCNPLSSCTSNHTLWPPNAPGSSPDNVPGKDLVIRADYTFHSSLAMVAPGGGHGPVRFGTFYFVGYTRQPIIF